MPHYQEPRGHVARLLFLIRAALTGAMDIAAGRNYISASTLATINTIRVTYKNALTALPALSSDRSKEVRESNTAVHRVEVHVRDMWDVMKRRVNRLGQPTEVHLFYGLPLNGNVPVLTTNDQWLQAAQTCIEGDAAAVLAGYPAMLNPSAAELAVVLTAAAAERDDVADADRELDLALAAADALVPQVDAVIEDVMAELRFNLRKMDYPSQRRIQRSYGATFRALPGEPGEGDHLQTIGTGNGALVDFNGTLSALPVEAGSLSATDGAEIFTDSDQGNGTGLLSGSSGGTGTINYSTGAISVKFFAPPTAGAKVEVGYVGGV